MGTKLIYVNFIIAILIELLEVDYGDINCKDLELNDIHIKHIMEEIEYRFDIKDESVTITDNPTRKKMAKFKIGDRVKFVSTIVPEKEYVINNVNILNEDVVLSDTTPKIGEILRVGAGITNTEYKLSYNKTLVKGDISLEVMYVEQDTNNIFTYLTDVPFAGMVEFDAIKEEYNRATAQEHLLEDAINIVEKVCLEMGKWCATQRYVKYNGE